MLHKISLNLSETLVKFGADKSKTAIYAYGLECLLSTAIILVIQFLIGAIMGRAFDVLIFTLFWLPLRVLVGGLHANTHFACTVISVGLCIASAALTYYINKIPIWLIFAVCAASYCVIFAIAPVVHKNHPVSNSHRIKMRKAARIFGAVELFLTALLYYLDCNCKSSAFMGFFSTAVLAVMGYFSKNTIKRFD